MSNAQPTYEEILNAANFLVEKGVLVTANNIKDQLGKGSITQIKTHMLERERQRNALSATFGDGISEKFSLAIAQEVRRIIQASTREVEEERDLLRQENLALKEKLAERETEIKSFAQERREWNEERSQSQQMFDMAQKTIQTLAQTQINRQPETSSDALLESIKLFLQQLADAFAYKSVEPQKNRVQNPPREPDKRTSTQKYGKNGKPRNNKKPRKKPPRGP